MLQKLLISTALVAGMGTAASAATVSYTANLPNQATDFSGASLGIQQFDASLGTLTSAMITLTGNLAGSAFFESLSGSAASIGLNLEAAVSLSTASMADIIVALPTFNQNVNVTAFDGTVDFGGTSGGTILGITASDIETATLTGADLSEFIGTGLVTLLVGGDGESEASGPANIFSGFETFAGADVTITYTFDEAPAPVPLPAGAPLLLLGLGAMGIARRRKG